MASLSLHKPAKADGPPASSQFYSFLNREFDQAAGGQTGFEILVAGSPLSLDKDVLKGFAERYQVIRRFQKITLELFKASLRGDEDPWIADTILSDIPAPLAHAYHRTLKDSHMQLPHFFRTDEPTPGILSEIQCPGSGWANHEAIRTLYDQHPETFGSPELFPETLSKSLANDLRATLNDDPMVYYLLDNSSLPHGARYFIQKTRQHGIRYYSWDPDLHPRTCNFVRSHDWISLLHNNFHRSHLEACEEGRLQYDLSPMALFDAKVTMALPFEELTRRYYDDEIRTIFPYTQVLRTNGIRASDGTWLNIESICQNSKLRRSFYAKYGGTDVNLNWGSRAVYALGSGSRVQINKLFKQFISLVRAGQPWILQEAHRCKNITRYVTKTGDLQEDKGYLKVSGFYGPAGLLGIIGYHLRAPKVHGTNRTILSIVR